MENCSFTKNCDICKASGETGSFFSTFFLGLGTISQVHIKCKEIDAKDTYENIDDSCKPGHVTEQKSDKVKSEQADQSPVDSTDDCYGQCCAI